MISICQTDAIHPTEKNGRLPSLLLNEHTRLGQGLPLQIRFCWNNELRPQVPETILPI